jgi:D-sedoheptulose 7-phosphate isomerase
MKNSKNSTSVQPSPIINQGEQQNHLRQIVDRLGSAVDSGDIRSVEGLLVQIQQSGNKSADNKFSQKYSKDQTVIDWVQYYLYKQNMALASIPAASIAELIGKLRDAVHGDRHVFFCGNGGSAGNASHAATDLGKGVSDKAERRFRCMSLNDNVPWMTAIANDYSYEDLFVRQLMNYARSGDVLITMSVSGNSPNVVKAVQWGKENGLHTVALIGKNPKGPSKLEGLADTVIMVDSNHFGRVEDAHMSICHMLCYAFMEMPGLCKIEPANADQLA